MHIGGSIDTLRVLSPGAWILLAYLAKQQDYFDPDMHRRREGRTPHSSEVSDYSDCDPDGWVWVADSVIEGDLNFTPRQRLRHQKELVKLGVMKTQKRSFGRAYFTFDWNALNKAVALAKQGARDE